MALSCVYGGSECTGCMRCQEESEEVRCPVCGQVAEKLYKDLYDEVVGCDVCIREVDPNEE